LNPPVSEAERAALAREYNAKVRKNLGLVSAPEVSVSAYAAADSAGVAVIGRF
jgi:hypothetical protein